VLLVGSRCLDGHGQAAELLDEALGTFGCELGGDMGLESEGRYWWEKEEGERRLSEKREKKREAN